MQKVLNIDKELQFYLDHLNLDQKRSLLEVIKSFIPAEVQETTGRYTQEELDEIYERREKYLEGRSKTYSVEEAHRLIRENRTKK